MKALMLCGSLIGLISVTSAGQVTPSKTPPRGPALTARVNIPYVDAKPIIETIQEDRLPTELKARTSAERELMWPLWVSSRDRTIRARIAQGDEDSIFNFLLFGTTFTTEPRVPDVLDSVHNASTAAVVQRRLDDMVAGLISARGNERLQLVRDAVERKGINPATVDGKREARLYLVDIIGRVVRERETFERATASAKQLDDPIARLATHSTLYRDRGLSSDTSIFPSFAIEQALTAIRSSGVLGNAPVRRVAIVGPGLDFTDKEKGYDFYPLQTIQPFATIDSLIRLEFAKPNELQIATFDLSSRVNRHLQLARQRARAGGAYTLTLPRNLDEHWQPDLLAYWRRMGDRIGGETHALAAPSNAGTVQVRAVRVRPAAVMSITAEDVDIVLQRLEQPDPRELFDLIIATNVLVYYDVFEQALAVANLAKMLRRGGLFLSNDLIFELPTSPMDSVGYTDVGYTDSGDGDRMFWYQRQ
jgi:hypothetical protein